MGEIRRPRVLVLRARGQASALAELLAGQGMEPVQIPAIEIVPPQSYDPLDRELARLGVYDWVIFTSANAVEVFASRGPVPDVRRIAVIGPATAEVVEKLLGRPADLLPQEFVAESLAGSLLPYAAGAEMLLVRAAVARDVLPEALQAAGARVTVVDAYRTVVPTASIAAVQELFRTGPPDAVAFTSGSTARNLADVLALAGVTVADGVVLASIGPVTSAAMRDVGFGVSVEAGEATIAGLVEALERGLAGKD